LKSFGIQASEVSEGCFVIPGKQQYKARDITVEGDWSNGAFLYALKSLGGELAIQGLRPESRQGDKLCVEYFEKLKEAMPELDISGCPDLGPVLFALAAAKNGAVISGTRRLKIKESDRTGAMKEELEKLGVRVELSDNSVTVFAPENGIHAPSIPLNGHNDHRIVMALSVLLTLTGGEITGAEAVGKTWKEFFEVLKGIGIKAEVADAVY
ncbi:MAG: 3-phosphoshikimate 1-carboxyvinyltransferase, partial [Lachnospiraceae bacterium]|nr:3-phosphoshikimate 1-carboxyvinyltransferase [Lachnospiraceae bacterium]